MRGSPDLDEARGSLWGCPESVKLILPLTHSFQQQAFIERPLYFRHSVRRWGESSFPTRSVMLALETYQDPCVSRGHSHPQGFRNIAKEIPPFIWQQAVGRNGMAAHQSSRPLHLLCPRS